jgi:hypothetical protein
MPVQGRREWETVTRQMVQITLYKMYCIHIAY